MDNSLKMEAFKQIERFFYKTILKSIFEKQEGLVGNTFASNLFKDLLVETLSETCSRKSLGIFKQFEDNIELDGKITQEGKSASRGNKIYRTNSKY